MLDNDILESWKGSVVTKTFYNNLKQLRQNCLESAMNAPKGERDSFIDRAQGVTLAISELENLLGGSYGDSSQKDM